MLTTGPPKPLSGSLTARCVLSTFVVSISNAEPNLLLRSRLYFAEMLRQPVVCCKCFEVGGLMFRNVVFFDRRVHHID